MTQEQRLSDLSETETPLPLAENLPGGNVPEEESPSSAWAERLAVVLHRQGFVDLSAGEDLSFALMNLISIEEHLACSYARTDDQAFLELLPEIRDMRRDLMKQLVREGNGEGWCISKHLLASSMRLLEVANKRQADGKEAASRDLIDKAFTLWSLFWTFTGDAPEEAEVTGSGRATSTQPRETKTPRSSSPRSAEEFIPGVIDKVAFSTASAGSISSGRTGNATGKATSGITRLVKAFIDCCRDG
ncbi:hypothetical protein [Aminiphilus circumscriptus]|jgi:hypothetical protein|uniref:hypothetical protein n=1 Tax=Aminiphilus circumscriptus TaxID=290732 RepID=UPI000478647A|nr:hypothetical protein [Aminiphilus circumscriptus]